MAGNWANNTKDSNHARTNTYSNPQNENQRKSAKKEREMQMYMPSQKHTLPRLVLVLTCFDRLALFESTSYLWKKEKRATVNALGSDGGWQELSWEHDRDYRQSKSASSLSQMISPEASGISLVLPSITGLQASSIKVTLTGLIGRHTEDCESIYVCAHEKEIRRKQEILCYWVNK